MQKPIDNHLFIEAEEYNGNLYGRSINDIREIDNTVCSFLN